MIDYNTPTFLLDKLTVLASIPRISIKMIILAPVEITWARQQSNIYLKLWSCGRHETCARINYRNMLDSNTITCLLRPMKKWSLKFTLVIRPVCPGSLKPDASTLPPPKNSRRSLNQHHDSADIKRLVYSFEFAFSHLQILPLTIS